MAHNRTPKPGSKYYLPKYRYKTIVNFCYQYNELKDELRAIDGWHSGSNDGMPHGSGTSDPVASDAIRRAEIAEKIDIIESAVRENISSVMQPYVLKWITDDHCNLDYLHTVMRCPLGKNQMVDLRRKVYFAISKKI